MKNENSYDSIERAIFERMTTEKGKYAFEDICRMTAQEICKRKGITLTDEFLKGFIEATSFEYERRRAINESLQNS